MRQLTTVAAFVFKVSMLIIKKQILLLILIFAGFYCKASEVQYLKIKAGKDLSLMQLSSSFKKICEQFNINFKACHSCPDWFAAEKVDIDLAKNISGICI